MATWDLEGATLRQEGDAVEIADAEGHTWIRVTAPAAFAIGGRAVEPKLAVHGSTIELWVDSAGCGCSTAGAPATTGAMWLGLGLILAIRRKPRRKLAA